MDPLILFLVEHTDAGVCVCGLQGTNLMIHTPDTQRDGLALGHAPYKEAVPSGGLLGWRWRLFGGCAWLSVPTTHTKQTHRRHFKSED